MFLIFTDLQGTESKPAIQPPQCKWRYSPRKICSENSIVEDVDSTDVADCKVAHRYKKGVSATKNTEDQIIVHALSRLSLLSLPHPQHAISHKVLPGPPSSPAHACSSLAHPRLSALHLFSPGPLQPFSTRATWRNHRGSNWPHPQIFWFHW